MSKKAKPTLLGKISRPLDGPTTCTLTFVRCSVCDIKYCVERDGKLCPECGSMEKKRVVVTDRPKLQIMETKDKRTPRKNAILFRQF